MRGNRSGLKSHSCSKRVLTYAPLAVAVLLGLAVQADAANIVVNSADAVSETGVCTIVDAVTALNTQMAMNGCAAGDGNNDTIDLTGFTTPTTISLTQAMAGTGHALVISNSVTINGGLNGQTPLVTLERSTVSGTDFGLIETGAPVTINGLTLSNGSSGSYAGGAILAGASLTLNYCVIQNNTSGGAGGGIAASAGQLSIAHSTITGNTANNAGGGIESNVSVQIYYSTVSKNSTLSGTAQINGGGGVFSSAALHSRNTTFDGNTSASSGGALYLANGANIDGSTISNNMASSGSGGGIFATTTAINVGTSTVNGNHASVNGGGINGGPVNLTNSTITGNTAGGIGGGVLADTLAATYATVALNSSTGAGGGVNFASGADSQATIFYSNTPNDLATTGTTAMTGQYNIVGVSTAMTPMDTRACDPKLDALANNGGPTLTMALLADSCAINTASDTPSVSVDQRGFGRPSTASANADVGAFESGATSPDVIFSNGFEP